MAEAKMKIKYCKECKCLVAVVLAKENLVGPSYCVDCAEKLGITLPCKIKDRDESE